MFLNSVPFPHFFGSRWISSCLNEDSVGSSSIWGKRHAGLLPSLKHCPDTEPSLHLIYEDMPPSRNGVQDPSSRVTKSRPKPKKTLTKPLDLNRWSGRLRSRRESTPAQSPEVHLQTEPNSLRPSNPNEAIGPESVGQKNRPLQRRRAEDDSEEAQPEASKQQFPNKKSRLSDQDLEPSALEFAGVQAIKPLTRENLNFLQETMPDPEQNSAAKPMVCSFVILEFLAM